MFVHIVNVGTAPGYNICIKYINKTVIQPSNNQNSE